MPAERRAPGTLAYLLVALAIGGSIWLSTRRLTRGLVEATGARAVAGAGLVDAGGDRRIATHAVTSAASVGAAIGASSAPAAAPS